MGTVDGALLEREVEGVVSRLARAAAAREETRDASADREVAAYSDGVCVGLQLALSWINETLEQARRVSDLRAAGDAGRGAGCER